MIAGSNVPQASARNAVERARFVARVEAATADWRVCSDFAYKPAGQVSPAALEEFAIPGSSAYLVFAAPLYLAVEQVNLAKVVEPVTAAFAVSLMPVLSRAAWRSRVWRTVPAILVSPALPGRALLRAGWVSRVALAERVRAILLVRADSASCHCLSVEQVSLVVRVVVAIKG